MPNSIGKSVSPKMPAASASAACETRAEPTLVVELPGGLAIERMMVTDITEVSELESKVFPDPWSADSFLAELDRRADIGYPIVLREEGELVGYAIVWFIVDEVHIGNIAVHPDRQRQGLGSLLLTHILSEGRRRSMVQATLEVRPSNEKARALYESFGFEQFSVRKRYYSDDHEDAWVLKHVLTSEGEDRVA